jgi:hypothetical protein
MTVEKILNTRIQLKYDTLANWNASSLKLKAGELAVVTLGEVKDGSAAMANQHPVLFKVGTGNHTFAELPFASALAADVYAWAKAATVTRTGKTLQFADAAGKVIHSVAFDYITDAEAQTKIENILKDYSTTAQMNTAISTAVADEATIARAAEKALQDRAKALEDAIGANGSVATQISNAIAALDSSASQTAGADGLALGVTMVDGKVTAISGSIAANTYDAYGSAQEALDEIGELRTEFETAGEAVQEALDNLKLVYITLVEGSTQPADNGFIADASMTGPEIFALVHEGRTALLISDSGLVFYPQLITDTTAWFTGIMDFRETDTLPHEYSYLEAKVDAQGKCTVTLTSMASEEALNAETSRATAAEAKALTDAKAYTDQVKNAILGEGISDTFDTLVEIQNWINGAGVNATELSEAIAAEAKTRGEADSAINARIDALGITDGKVAKAALADKASGLDASGEAAVKAVKVDNAVNADKLGGVAAANYATKTYADDAKAAAITSANANTAEVIKNYYTKSEAEAAFMNSTETGSAIDAKITALNLATTYEPIGAESRAKSYADSLAGNYATAAQGTKADSALQAVEVGTGLKVSAKANNKQTIEIDDTVVFVFNCGDS